MRHTLRVILATLALAERTADTALLRDEVNACAFGRMGRLALPRLEQFVRLRGFDLVSVAAFSGLIW